MYTHSDKMKAIRSLKKREKGELVIPEKWTNGQCAKCGCVPSVHKFWCERRKG